ncbi:putative FtsJ-like methyltransferase [Namao virus]|nr:putative FtsJ-like methyltransferase [Namao virus]
MLKHIFKTDHEFKFLCYDFSSSPADQKDLAVTKYVYNSKACKPLFKYGFNIYILQSKDKLQGLKTEYHNKRFHVVTHAFEPVPFSSDDRPESISRYFCDFATSLNVGADLVKKLVNDESGAYNEVYSYWEIFMLLKEYMKTCGKFKMAKECEMCQIALDIVGAWKNSAINPANSQVDLFIGNNVLPSKDFVFNIDQETEVYQGLIDQIIEATGVLRAGGTMILKLYYTNTSLTHQIIIILSTLFKEVYLYKPFTSRLCDADRYLICIDLVGKVKSFPAIKIPRQKYLRGIETDDKYRLSEESFKRIDKNLTFSSSELTAQQFMNINQIINYITEKNYLGEKYQCYIKIQKKALEFWKKHFIMEYA